MVTNTLHIDPTRTTTLRRQFESDLIRRFKGLILDIRRVLVEENALALNAKYGCLMLMLNDPWIQSESKRIQGLLESDDILKLEDEPHVTVRYGFHEVPDVERKVFDLVKGTGVLTVRFGKLSLFEGEEQDVLKLEADSKELRKLHTRLESVPHTDTHKGYNPHLTIAYLKPGTGQKYLGVTSAIPKTYYTTGVLEYSTKAEERTTLTLHGGTGSGNFGHKGRPGQVGGSGSGYLNMPKGLHTVEGQKRLIEYLEKETGSKFKPWGSLSKGKEVSEHDIDISIVPATEDDEQAAYIKAMDEEAEDMDKVKAGKMSHDEFMQKHFGDPEPEAHDAIDKAMIKIGYEPSKVMSWLGIDVRQFIDKDNNHTVEIWIPGEAGYDNMGTTFNQLEEMIHNGGQGSGNFGHKGRPGLIGGSSSLHSDIVSIMRELEPRANTGTLVSIRDIRKVAALPKADFDKLLIEMGRKEVVSLHKHDYVAPYTKEQLADDFVFLPDSDARGCGDHPKGLYFGSAAIRSLTTHGGQGSGNFGHSGRPGQVGGSSPNSNVPALVPSSSGITEGWLTPSGNYGFSPTVGSHFTSITRDHPIFKEELLKLESLDTVSVLGLAFSKGWVRFRSEGVNPTFDAGSELTNQKRLIIEQFLEEYKEIFRRSKRLLIDGYNPNYWQLSFTYEEFESNDFRIPSSFLANTRWSFQSPTTQVSSFKEWLEGKVKRKLPTGASDAWYDKYIREAFRKGITRAYDDVKGPSLGIDLKTLRGAKGQFAATLEVLPQVRERVKLLATKVFTDLDGINKSLSQRIVKTLIDGMIQGTKTDDIVKQMTDQLNIEARRARGIISDTITRMHSEGQLDAMEALGVTHVNTAVEWTTTGKPCPKCKAMANLVLTIQEARGLIPRHPNCKCKWKGVRSIQDQIKLSTKARILKAITKSLKDEKRSRWAGATLSVKRSKK